MVGCGRTRTSQGARGGEECRGKEYKGCRMESMRTILFVLFLVDCCYNCVNPFFVPHDVCGFSFRLFYFIFCMVPLI